MKEHSENVARPTEPKDIEDRDIIEQMVANGELCSFDGKPCELETVTDDYGADRDGNRGTLIRYDRCHKCGEVS